MYTLRDLASKARVTETASENLASVDDRLRAVRRETYVVREEEKVTEIIAPANKGLMLPELDLFEALAWMRHPSESWGRAPPRGDRLGRAMPACAGMTMIQVRFSSDGPGLGDRSALS